MIFKDILYFSLKVSTYIENFRTKFLFPNFRSISVMTKKMPKPKIQSEKSSFTTRWFHFKGITDYNYVDKMPPFDDI